MSVALIDARTDRRWPDLAAHPLASLFTAPPWLEALARTYDFGISAAVRTRAGALESAVPFTHVSDLRGERVVCLPFSDYCDPLVESAAAWEELVEPLLALGVPITLRCLRSAIPAGDERFEVAGRALWHSVDLARPEAELWAGLSGSARQNVRRARRNGVVVREGKSLDDVRLFHRMHCHVRKTKYRLLAQPAAFFEHLHAVFAPTDRITVLLAEVDEVAIAGILFLEWGDTLYYKFNASLDLVLRPNDLLVWEGMLLGHHRGLARLDFGLSDPEQPGLVRFKEKFADQVHEIQRLRWQPRHYVDPRAELAAGTLGRVTRLLTDPTVPDEITRAAGDELYRLFC